MQKEYQGELKELKDIQPGTPVEIVAEKESFRINSATLGQRLPENLIGVVTGFAKNYDEKTRPGLLPKVSVLDANGKTFVRAFAEKALPGSLKPFKVLTGRRAITLRQLVAEELSTGINGFLFKEPAFTVGCDPEMFVVDGQGKLMPAFEFLASKRNRAINAPFWDGFQAEFTPGADPCWANGVDYVQKGLKSLLDVSRKYKPDARLTVKNVFEIERDILQRAEKEHVELGCKPSLNAYGDSGEKVGECRDLPWRFAGGHVHLGHPRGNEAQIVEMVKAIDAIAGVACVGMFEGIDDPIRRRFYGLAGEYRLPNHGLEYRTLSNAWLSHPAISHLVVDLVRGAAWFGANGLRGYWNATEDEVKGTINQCDVAKAREIITRNERLFQAVVSWVYEHSVTNLPKPEPKVCVEATKIVVMNGIKSVLNDHDDVVGNWMLDAKTEAAPKQQVNELYPVWLARYRAWQATSQMWMNHSESPNKQFHKAAHVIIKGEKV